MAHTTNAAKVFELIRTVACMSSRLLSQLCVVVQIIVKLVQTNKTPIKSENTKTHAKVTFPCGSITHKKQRAQTLLYYQPFPI